MTRSPLRSATAQNPARASIDPPVASALVEIRQRLTLAAPAPRLRHVAFGKNFVVQLTAEAAVVTSTLDGKELFRAPLTSPRAAVGLPGGSVLLAALDASYQINPGERLLRPRTRLSLLPGSLLEPSRENPEYLWIVERKRAVRYALSADAGIGLIAEWTLLGFDGGALTTLRDGSFLYSAGRELAHAQPLAKPRFLRLPAEIGEPWRLLAADRIDRAWAALATGDLLLLEIGARVRLIRTLNTGRLPIDFAASPTRLALLSVVEAPRVPREFVLSVYTNEGRELFSRPVGSRSPSASADWAANALQDHELVVSSDAPQVAVGGPGMLRVFDLDSGLERIGPAR